MSIITQTMDSPLFKSFFITLFVVGGVDLLALAFHLFNMFMWFDMVMHSLGGFFISIASLTFLTTRSKEISYGRLLLWGVGAAFVVGILWELFELYYGITYFWSPGYWGDNGMDVTMDTLGGLLAVWVSYYKLKSVESTLS